MNTTLIDSYFTLLNNLSPDEKLELISRLSKSLKTRGKSKNQAWKSLYGSLTLDQSAEEFSESLRRDRVFIRKTVDL